MGDRPGYPVGCQIDRTSDSERDGIFYGNGMELLQH